MGEAEDQTALKNREDEEGGRRGSGFEMEEVRDGGAERRGVVRKGEVVWEERTKRGTWFEDEDEDGERESV